MRYYEIMNRKLSEIVDIGDYDNKPSEINRLQNNFDNMKMSSKLRSGNIYSTTLDGYDYYLYIENNNIFGMLKVSNHDIYHLNMVVYSWVDVEYRGKGIMSQLMYSYVENKGSLYSDQQHTNSAKELWKKIIDNPRYPVVIHNLSNNTEREYIKGKDNFDDIWNDDTDIILGIVK